MLNTGRTRRTGIALTAGLLIAAGIAGSGQAQASRDYNGRQYLNPANTKSVRVGGHELVTSGIEQCDKPVAQRTGNWFCLPTATATTSSTSTGKDVQAASTTTYCHGGSCWSAYSDFESSYNGTGTFGAGGTVYGNVTLYFDVQLNGSQSVSKPVRLTTSTSITNLVISGNRLYYSTTYPQGNEVNGGSQYKTYSVGSVSAGSTGQWASPGYRGYENSDKHGSVVHEWDWKKSGKEGDWYAYDKSVKFDRTVASDGTVIMRFGPANYLGQDPSGGGHHA